MRKKVIVLNGSGGVGKDTFISLLNHYMSAYKYSIVDKVKYIMKISGIPFDLKTEEDRKTMSDIKLFLEKWDIPYKDVEKHFVKFLCDEDHKDHELFSVDMREKHDIERFSDEYNAIKVLVVNDRVKQITSNIADNGVFDIEYDYIIHNNGTLDELDNEAKKFAEFLRNGEEL